MKGISQGIPAFFYVIVALVVALIMILMITNFSPGLFPGKVEVTIGGSEIEISEAMAEIIEKCWEKNRKGLESKSMICKIVNFEENLKIEEIDVNNYIDCEILPNTNCYIYPETWSIYNCNYCSSPFFDDTDKILWLAEIENSEVRIEYWGDKRKVAVIGLPCDNVCICKRYCKRICIEGSPDCVNCFSNCV
jgi:hypothetical protein